MVFARIPAPALALAPAPFSTQDLDAFAAGIAGTVIGPEDPGYDDARQVHDALVDGRPLRIVRAVSSADVARTVLFAAETGLRARGPRRRPQPRRPRHGRWRDRPGPRQHEGPPHRPERRLAWAGAGLTAGEYTAAAAAHGLATPFGDTGSVGIAGLTLGGGIGWLVRKYGLAIDALRLGRDRDRRRPADHAPSETEHPDLFWAVRGGGGNFGVVTRFQFRLYPVATVLGGALSCRRPRRAAQPRADRGEPPPRSSRRSRS